MLVSLRQDVNESIFREGERTWMYWPWLRRLRECLPNMLGCFCRLGQRRMVQQGPSRASILIGCNRLHKLTPRDLASRSSSMMRSAMIHLGRSGQGARWDLWCDVPDEPARYEATWSSPPVPEAFAVSFLASSAEKTPAPNCAVRYPWPPTAMPILGKDALKMGKEYPIEEPFPSQSDHAVEMTLDSLAETYDCSWGFRDCVCGVNVRTRTLLGGWGQGALVFGA